MNFNHFFCDVITHMLKLQKQSAAAAMMSQKSFVLESLENL